MCALYYIAWIYVIPKLRGYRVRTEIVEVDDNGANTHRLVQVPLVNVAQWDAEHDDAGNLRRRAVPESDEAESPRGEPKYGSN